MDEQFNLRRITNINSGGHSSCGKGIQPTSVLPFSLCRIAIK
jgi:hypothetical protein